MSEKYNGWTNYETWLVALWIDNDYGMQRDWQDQAQELYDGATPGGLISSFSREENATADLRERLKDYFDDSAEDNELRAKLTGMYADLLNAALSEVNWHEIAEHYVTEVQKEEPEEAEVDE